MPTRRGPTRPTKRGRHRTQPVPSARALGEMLKQLRLERGFSFDAFVGETELGRGYVSELERGLVVPTLRTLERVATALNLTVADLVLTDATARERLFALTRNLSEDVIARLIRQAESAARESD